MKTILITGGTGDLGSALADEARAAGHRVRIMSRRPAPATLPPQTEWAQADVLTGAGLGAAVEGIDTIIHAATSPRNNAWKTEVEGVRQMAAFAKAARTAHFIYVSIVGIDRIPPSSSITTDPARVPYYYYRAKLAAEQIVERSGTDYTILRATQFHSLMDMFIGLLFRLPVTLLPSDFVSQPIATHDAARAFVRFAEGTAQGHAPDIGGPQVLTWGEMARAWLQVRNMKRLWLPLRLPGRFAAVFREGYTTCPDARIGAQTWEAWLEERYARRYDDARRPLRET
jgi:uncharacterized protein YbjT (DUF2867 family)